MNQIPKRFFVPLVLLTATFICIPQAWSQINPGGHYTERQDDPLPDDYFSIATERQSTTQEIEKVSVIMKYRNHRRDLFFPYADETPHLWDVGFTARTDFGSGDVAEYFAVGGYLLVSRRLPKRQMQLDGYLGFRNLSDKATSERSFIPAFLLDHYWIIKQSMKLNTQFSHDFAIDDIFQPGTISRLVQKTALKSKFALQPKENLRFPIEAELSIYSDENTQRRIQGAALYGLSPSWPWIWAGIQAEYESFSRQKLDYYSPSTFLVFGPKVELAFDLMKSLYLAVDLYANKFKEQPSGRERYGAYASIELQYGNREDLNASVKISRDHTGQLGSKFANDSIGLLIATPL